MTAGEAGPTGAEDVRIPGGPPTILRSTSQAFVIGDERALHAGLPTVRVAVLSEGALSVGVSQRDDARCIVRAREFQLPVVRRTTGGLGLWHAPGDVVWSVVLPRTDPRVGSDFARAYARLGVGPARVLEEMGLVGAWQAPRGGPGEFCLISGRGAVLVVGGRAIGGAAQHLTRLALLHHGVLPYRLDRAQITALFGLSAEEIDRSLAGWEDVAPTLTPRTLAERLRTVLVREFAAPEA